MHQYYKVGLVPLNLKFSDALHGVKLSIQEVASETQKRHLFMYSDKISCAPKCSGCCKRKVDITIAEAIVMYDYLVRSGRWLEVKAAAKSLQDIAMTASGMAWFKMDIPCPVLSNDLCMAYEVRPVACSTHFVSSDKDLCQPLSMKSGQYEPIFMVDLFDKFAQKLQSSVDEHGILQTTAPIPLALLMAESVNVKRDMTVQEMIQYIRNEISD